MKNHKTEDVVLIGPKRYSGKLGKLDYAHKMGEMAGYWVEDKQQHLRVIDAYFKQHIVEKVNSLREQLYKLVSRRKSYEFQLQRITKTKLAHKPTKGVQLYSILDALLYTALGLLFWSAEVAVLMGTIANALGMNITFDEITLSDPASYDGLLLALAIAASPFILKLWLERYVISGIYQKQETADKLFQYLLIPVGVLTVLFIALTGLFRWHFQPLIMDPSEYLIWKEIFTTDGRYAILGAVFMVAMVLALLLSSSLSLSIGLYHLKAILSSSYRSIASSKYHLLKFCRSLRTRSLIFRKERIAKEIADHPDKIKREISALETKRNAVRQAFITGYNSGKLRKDRFHKKQVEKEHKRQQQLFTNMPLHHYVRHLVTENTPKNGLNRYPN